MIWINGEQKNYISVNDRAIHYGDGCFTSARLRHGNIDLLANHLYRLREATATLKIYDIDWNKLKNEMLMAAESWPKKKGVIKVIITRGLSKRGYSTIDCLFPTRIIMLSSIPYHYISLRESGVRLSISSVRLSINPQFAGIKHLNRLEQVLVHEELEQIGTDEALVLDTEGKIVECCSANLFWRKKNQLYTPELNGSGVNGVMRRYVFNQAQKNGYYCYEVRETPKTLRDADEVFITNSLMPILPVRCIDEWYYESRMLYQLLMQNNDIMND